MKILLVYGTTEGQTKKIAEFLKAEFERLKYTVVLCDATVDPPGAEGFDAILVGASLHLDRYQTAIAFYIHKYKTALNAKCTAFFSVSLIAATDDIMLWKEMEDTTTKFLEAAGWKPSIVEYVAGALLYTRYDFFKKLIVRQMAKKSYGNSTKIHDKEYTDWVKLRSFVQKMDELLNCQPQIVAKEESDFEAVC
jgi:menaquinone-dependent protoporphyrinogen oxidase